MGTDDNARTPTEDTSLAPRDMAAGLRARRLARLHAQARQMGSGQSLATCGDPPPAGLIRGIEQFNQHEYFECHETLENLWNEEPGAVRILYKGILQVGVGCYHLLKGNYRGAVIKLQTGADYLEAFSPGCMSVNVAKLVEDARSLRKALMSLGPDHVTDVDQRMLPIVRLLDHASDSSKRPTSP